MPSTIRQRSIWRYGSAVIIFTPIIMSAGCTTPRAIPTSAAREPVTATAPSSPTTVPVVRYGRYSLVELAPGTAQHNLLLQIVDISMPVTMSATVGDGLRYVLLRSGYQLCQAPDVGTFDSLPLPAAHLHLGPMFLGEALQTLAGSAWQLQVDDIARRVCFMQPANATGARTPTSRPPVSPAPEKPESAKTSVPLKEHP